MPTSSYLQRRGQLLEYFDRTAVDAWKRLTSDAPVTRIRATVRAGRDAMRAALLGCLPEDLSRRRVLDAGCGTGALSVEAAKRGAAVVAIDLSPSLVELARERLPATLGEGRIEFRVGDMHDPALGRFDHVVAMDSLIHYRARDTVRVLAGFAARVDGSILFTFAPASAFLWLFLGVGRLFPRSDRSPAIEPVSMRRLAALIAAEPGLAGWTITRTQRIKSGFYTSQMVELRRAGHGGQPA